MVLGRCWIEASVMPTNPGNPGKPRCYTPEYTPERKPRNATPVYRGCRGSGVWGKVIMSFPGISSGVRVSEGENACH